MWNFRCANRSYLVWCGTLKYVIVCELITLCPSNTRRSFSLTRLSWSLSLFACPKLAFSIALKLFVTHTNFARLLSFRFTDLCIDWRDLEVEVNTPGDVEVVVVAVKVVEVEVEVDVEGEVNKEVELEGREKIDGGDEGGVGFCSPGSVEITLEDLSINPEKSHK